MGVAELNLDFSKGTDMDNGNLLGLVGSYTGTDGSERAMVDVWFAKQDAAAPSVAELLSGPPAELLGSADTGGAARGATAAGSLVSRTSIDDELLRNNGLLI